MPPLSFYLDGPRLAIHARLQGPDELAC